MVSFHPIQEEARLLYYRTVPPCFDPSTLDQPSTIQKPDMSIFTNSAFSQLEEQHSSTRTTDDRTELLYPIPIITTSQTESNTKSIITRHLSPIGVSHLKRSIKKEKSPTAVSSPVAISKKKKNSDAVKSFVFKHNRSNSGTSGSFDSAIRTILH